ncbi:pentatricopeptide repeat-containing protein At5g04780, mitochondrial-like [Apium graveolens]|uniref:pentatricopeptide repeat-containing protein At5g04780, mitochondrial-like n=1 Tax=Apium graveolens TaxID=4045 RepID=UPI003D7A62D6
MSHFATATCFSSILRNCSPLLSSISTAKKTHAQILICGLLPNITLQTDLLLVYSKCGLLNDARRVFDRMPDRSMHSWNIMISTHMKNCLHKDGLSIFNAFVEVGMRPDHYTLTPLFKACGEVGDMTLGLSLHNWVIKCGYVNYVVVGSALLEFYLKCREAKDAKRVFDDLMFKDSVAWNSMISGLVRLGSYVDALVCFRDMLKEGMVMDRMAIPSILSACGREGDVMKGKEIHGQVVKSLRFCDDVTIVNALIDMYSKCGFLYNSENVFKNMISANLVSWTTMISCYGVHGKGKESLVLFEEMKVRGFEPNSVTITAILASCSHSGLVDQGKKIFDSLGLVYNIEPCLEHYACIIDLLGRSGLVEEAFELIKNMKLDPTASIWGALLAGCMMCRNVEIGEIAAHHLFDIEPKNTSNYIALCSIYESLGMRDGVSRIRSIIRNTGIFKSPGCSCITIKGKIHKFYQGDVFHPSGNILHETMDGILRTLMSIDICV